MRTTPDMHRSSVGFPTCLAAASLVIVFIVDLMTPVHLVIDILYLACILLTFRQNSRTIIAFSITACVLILLNAFLNPRSTSDITVWLNRLISISAICIVSYIALSYRKASKKGSLKEQQYLSSLEEMNFITSHQVRKPVANIMGLVDTISSDREAIPVNELKERCNLLRHSAAELDDYILELNNAIRDAEEKHRE